MFRFSLSILLLLAICFFTQSRYGWLDRVMSIQALGDTEELEFPTSRAGLVYVTKVIDGDTFWVQDGTENFKVRLIGIDAPETRNSRHKEKGFFAQEAKAYVQKLTEKKWVKLETDVRQKDRYQRVLAYVYLEDDTFLNADLLQGGYAVVDTHPPNVKYVDLFIELQRVARGQQVGLWASELTK